MQVKEKESKTSTEYTVLFPRSFFPHSSSCDILPSRSPSLSLLPVSPPLFLKKKSLFSFPPPRQKKKIIHLSKTTSTSSFSFCYFHDLLGSARVHRLLPTSHCAASRRRPPAPPCCPEDLPARTCPCMCPADEDKKLSGDKRMRFKEGEKKKEKTKRQR